MNSLTRRLLICRLEVSDKELRANKPYNITNETLNSEVSDKELRELVPRHIGYPAPLYLTLSTLEVSDKELRDLGSPFRGVNGGEVSDKELRAIYLDVYSEKNLT